MVGIERCLDDQAGTPVPHDPSPVPPTPNVVTNGHWWYSNTPTFIEHDLACRLEAVPRSKQIGYYSDMYKLEFALPKFAMYKRILAKVLAERFVIDRGWPETRAVEFGRQVLRGNVERVFGF